MDVCRCQQNECQSFPKCVGQCQCQPLWVRGLIGPAVAIFHGDNTVTLVQDGGDQEFGELSHTQRAVAAARLRSAAKRFDEEN